MSPTPQEFEARQEAAAAAPGERVVISGMSGLFPSAHHVAEFADILYNKINPVTAEDCRWNYNHPELSQCTGKVPGLLYFDAQFFKVHYRLGNSMDSMSRKILEQAYQAIYDAGVSPEHLSGKKIGVYVGTCFSETEKTVFYAAISRAGFGIAGCSKAMFANRISYWLNAKGPSMSIDGACCSSTAALERAYQDIQRGECEAAIVGGSNLCLHPQSSIHYGRIMKLSMDEKTKSFDENADGCTKSEAINVLFLQKAKDALRIYAEVVYVKSEFTSLLESEAGPRYGFYRNPDDTVRFLKSFYEEAKVSPAAVEYVEACGSAVKESDKAELEALEKIFCDDRHDPLLVGSVMSNVGYGEAASGITAITKVLLGYHKGVLAGNLHCENPRRDIAALREGRMRVLQDHSPFRRSYAAVNGLSVTGVNAHVLLHGHYKQKDLSRYKSSIPHLVLVSGRTVSAVDKVLKDLESRSVDPEELALLNNIHLTLISGNLGRGFTILGSNDEGRTISLNKKSLHFDYVKRPLWFVYSGMGSQWAGMGAMLMRIPVFAAAIHRCHQVLQPKGLDIVHIITTSDKKIFDNILHSFVGIAAIQIGLTDILRELGLVPDKIIGHSVGELGCAYADGCFTAEEMILSAYSRGLVSLQTPFIRGSMAAVGVGYEQILPMCPPAIEVACHNSPESCTISGPADAMREFVAELVSKDIFAKEVPCSNIAYHSRYIADAGPGLLKYLTEVIKCPKARSERWVSTSVPMENWEAESAKYSSAEYHTNNLLSPVLFEESSRLIPSNAVLVEVAPHGLLQAILKRSLPDSCRNIPLTRRGHANNAVFLLEAIGKLYLEGFNPSIQNIYPKIEFPVSTGTPMLSHLVEWAHFEKWSLPLYMSASRKTAAVCKYVISIHDDEHSYLQGHVIQGKILYPYTASLVAVWDTLAMTNGVERRRMPVQFRDVTLYSQPVLHDRRQLRVAVALHRATGRFEVMDDINSKIASGFITMEDDIVIQSEEKIENQALEITAKDIYNNFLFNDINYKDDFQSILSANVTLTEGLILWRNNWATFIDGLIQLNALRHSNDSNSEPKFIRKLIIVPDSQNQPIMRATISDIYNSTRCGGVLMENIIFHNPKKASEDLLTLKPLKYGPHLVSEQFDEKYAKVNEMSQISLVGQMGSLQWVQALPQRESGVLVKVHYAGLNNLDAKTATGSIQFANESGPCGYGMDFSGVTESGMRVMGLVKNGAVSSRVVANPDLLWPVPAHWSLEDAATVPLAYCLAYYCLSIKCQLYPGKKVLVHGGAGALGQAAISIALATNCEVFTTVSDLRKKIFLLKMFPELKAENIGNSRDNSFYDMVLNSTKSKGVFIVIGSQKGELRTVSLKCVGFMGAYVDVNLIRNNEKYIFGWNNLQNERGYITVSLEAIFHEKENKTMKVLTGMTPVRGVAFTGEPLVPTEHAQVPSIYTDNRLQQLVCEGIARGWVRPLSRVTYLPGAAPRAFRLLAASNQRGRVLLHLHAAGAAHAALATQPGLQCSPDQWHVIISDHGSLGSQLADVLVRRGVRKLLLYLPLSSKDFKLKARQWQSIGVQLSIKEVGELKNDFKLFNKMQYLEGIYIIITDKSKSESVSNSIIKEMDAMSRRIFPNLKYFAVLNAVNNAGEETCISRVNDHFAGTMLTIPELKEAESGPGTGGARLTARVVAEAAERALAGGAAAVEARAVHAATPPLLHRLAELAEINIPETIDETTTLSEIGINPAKYSDISIFLRNTMHVCFTEKEIKSLTIQRIKQIDETLTRTDFDHEKGLKKLFSYVDSDELQSVTEMVFLPTLSSSSTMRDDEFDVSQTHLCIVPGVEGHHARFRTLCERLKLPALVLQPGLDRPHESVPELANRYAQILLTKSALKQNFYLLGYESGVIVALEMAAILEDKGFTGVIFCIGTPDEVKTEIKEHLRGLETDEALQDAVIRHMFVLMTNSSVDDLEGALQGASSWQEKLSITVRALLGRVSHSAQYARQLIEAAQGRAAQQLRYECAVRALRSRLVLLRPASRRAARAALAALQPHSRQPVTVHDLRAPLAHAAEDLRCAAIINSYLDHDILEQFNKKNLCETYLLNADAFMTQNNNN